MKKFKSMHIFKSKNMLVPCYCAILNIKEATYNEHLILNSPSQNDMIKVGTWRFAKKSLVKFGGLPSKPRNFCPCNAPPLHLLWLQLAQFKHSRLYLSRHKNKISSYYNIKPLKSHISFENFLNYYYFAQIIQSMFLWDKNKLNQNNFSSRNNNKFFLEHLGFAHNKHIFLNKFYLDINWNFLCQSDNKSCLWAFISVNNGSHIWGSRVMMETHCKSHFLHPIRGLVSVGGTWLGSLVERMVTSLIHVIILW